MIVLHTFFDLNNVCAGYAKYKRALDSYPDVELVYSSPHPEANFFAEYLAGLDNRQLTIFEGILEQSDLSEAHEYLDIAHQTGARFLVVGSWPSQATVHALNILGIVFKVVE